VIVFTLYSRPGCHLCELMKPIVERVAHASSAAVRIDEIDISTDAELERLYGLEIPVLLIDGKKAAKIRVTEAELRRILRSRQG
jgi:glutaredoxin-like protein DUF836